MCSVHAMVSEVFYPEVGRLDEVFEKMFQSMSDTFGICLPKTGPKKDGWTDEMCLIKGRKECLWKPIPENEVEGHLIRFLNLWFSETGVTAHCGEIWTIVRNVLLMTPLGMSDELLFKDVFDEAKHNARTPSAVNSRQTGFKKPIRKGLNSTEKTQSLAFLKWLVENFVQLQTAKENNVAGQPCCPEYNSASQKLRTVLGFCALILMRLMTKTEDQVERCFSSDLTRAFNRLFPDVGLNVLIVPPKPIFMRLRKGALSKSGRVDSTRSLLYLLVFQYLKSTAKGDKSSEFTVQILKKGCLDVMEGNGMGLVTLFQDVKLRYSYIEEQLLLSIIVSDTTKSSKRLIKFLDNYQGNKSQYSWKWARILSSDHFSDLTIESNQALCSKFAALLVDQNPSIFNHKDLRNPDYNFIEDAMKWAESAKIGLQELNDDLKQISG